MKTHCEKCSCELGKEPAYACSYKCTFCKKCTDAMNAICPNCQGNLVKISPKR